MDRIRILYCRSDAKPRIQISQFMRYLGFYIEDIAENTGKNNKNSLMDIYVISDAYVEANSVDLDIENESRAILIYMDGWQSDQLQDIRSIQYDELNDDGFLKQLLRHMISILSDHSELDGRLIGSVDDPVSLLDSLIDIYVKNEVLQVTLFARCFYARRDFCKIAQSKYFKFIRNLKQIEEKDGASDLIKYIYIRARYEFDFICLVNSFSLYYNPRVLEEECGELLQKYTDNETLRILHADINYLLNDAWNKAGYEYSDSHLADCAYAYFRKGQILERYVGDLNKALEAYHAAAQRKKDYPDVWLCIGNCYDQQMKYMDALSAYERVLSILWGSYQRHVLAPLEILYLFYATRKMAEISALRFKNYRVADDYIELADNIREEAEGIDYFRLMWSDSEAFKKYYPLIKEELDDKLEEYKKYFMYGGKRHYEYEWEKN